MENNTEIKRQMGQYASFCQKDAILAFMESNKDIARNQ